MIIYIKIEPFWNRVRFSIPYPQRGLTQNTRSQISESAKICQNLRGVCQDLPGICQESAGQRLHPRTFLTYTGPVMPAKSQTARPQNGGAAVTGRRPPSMNYFQKIKQLISLKNILVNSQAVTLKIQVIIPLKNTNYRL